MLNKITSLLLVVVVVLGITSYGLYVRSNRLQKERDTYKQNTHSLLSDFKRIQIDSTTMAADVKVLKLTLDEYEQYRAEDLETIKKMKAQIKSLQVAAKHELEINAPISAALRDTLVLRDTTTIKIKTIKVNTPHLQISGTIENDSLQGNIHLPVNLHQAIWVEHKHRFLWWRWGVKAVHQTISSDNPHVQIKYSEYIQIAK
jgi:hypothetical protein